MTLKWNIKAPELSNFRMKYLEKTLFGNKLCKKKKCVETFLNILSAEKELFFERRSILKKRQAFKAHYEKKILSNDKENPQLLSFGCAQGKIEKIFCNNFLEQLRWRSSQDHFFQG